MTRCHSSSVQSTTLARVSTAALHTNTSRRPWVLGDAGEQRLDVGSPT